MLPVFCTASALVELLRALPLPAALQCSAPTLGMPQMLLPACLDAMLSTQMRCTLNNGSKLHLGLYMPGMKNISLYAPMGLSENLMAMR
jgi:hypothetical protein